MFCWYPWTSACFSAICCLLLCQTKILKTLHQVYNAQVHSEIWWRVIETPQQAERFQKCNGYFRKCCGFLPKCNAFPELLHGFLHLLIAFLNLLWRVISMRRPVTTVTRPLTKLRRPLTELSDPLTTTFFWMSRPVKRVVSCCGNKLWRCANVGEKTLHCKCLFYISLRRWWRVFRFCLLTINEAIISLNVPYRLSNRKPSGQIK